MNVIQRLRDGGEKLLDNALLLNATKAGYYLRESGWDPNETWVSMHDKVCVVTGANSGLGKAVSTRLAALGARVSLACRSDQRGKQAQLEIIDRSRNPNVFLERVDVSRRESITKFVERFAEKEDRLDVLINNAGVFMPERQMSEDGLELTFATNTLGPFLLTNRLLPMLRRSARSRILTVSSGAMYFARLNLSDPQFERRPYVGALAYAESKRAEVVLTQLWARRLKGTGVGAHAMHPGWADTRTAWESAPGFAAPIRPLLRTPEQGADTLLWLAVNPELTARDAGQFWFDRRARETHRFGFGRSTDDEMESFWQICSRLSGWSWEPVAGH